MSMMKVLQQNELQKRTTENNNYNKILRKAAIAPAKASKYGWPIAPNDTLCEEEAEAKNKTQEEVIHIFSKACAAASVVCRDFIISTYPQDSERIMAQKMQQIDDDDSSKDITTADEANVAGPSNQIYTSYLKKGRSKGKGKTKNREGHELRHAPPACSLSIGVCGRPLWADPKTSMMPSTCNFVLCLVVCSCLWMCLSSGNLLQSKVEISYHIFLLFDYKAL